MANKGRFIQNEISIKRNPTFTIKEVVTEFGLKKIKEQTGENIELSINLVSYGDTSNILNNEIIEKIMKLFN